MPLMTTTGGYGEGNHRALNFHYLSFILFFILFLLTRILIAMIKKLLVEITLKIMFYHFKSSIPKLRDAKFKLIQLIFKLCYMLLKTFVRSS